MIVSIGGNEYQYIPNAIQSDQGRESYFNLVQKVFGLRFQPWYQSGFCGNRFMPHTLFDGGVAVSSVGVVCNDFKWRNDTKKYAQISTVVTEPSYRGRGLSRWLMRAAVEEWETKCDCVYLYANDSVVDFYPKFGFVPACEYRYHKPIAKREGLFRKLDLSIQRDVDLLIRKHGESNPFSLLTMDGNIEMMMFHCINYLREHIFYIAQYDAVVIAEYIENDIFCYDLYTNSICCIDELLGIIALENPKTAVLGFTPKNATGYTIEKANEGDTKLFMLSGKENILKNNRITFPFLSRA